jgi:multidrug efflux pump subunit AcrA (membrane-fusion protein)
VIAELDTSTLKNNLEEAQGQLNAARGQAGRAGAYYASMTKEAKLTERLVKAGAMAPWAAKQKMAEAQAYGGDGGAAAGQMQSARAKIAEIKKQLEVAKIVAPFDGKVSAIKVREGETASRSGPIVRIYDPQQMVIKFAVPRKQVSLVKTGANIELVTKQDHITVPANVQTQYDAADPAVDFVVFEAVIDPNFRTDGIRVGDNGYVRIAGAQR